MLHFEGDRTIPRPPAEVWTRLSDARFLVQCIPDAEIIGEPSQTTAKCKVRPGVAFIRGTLEVVLQVLEAVEPSGIRLALDSKAIGASSSVETNMTLSPQQTGTQIHWTADVKSLGGLLKLIPQGLIRGTAQKVINDVWAQVETKLTA
jgi:carbon monoxide dehydrogenase subunit G